MKNINQMMVMNYVLYGKLVMKISLNGVCKCILLQVCVLFHVAGPCGLCVVVLLRLRLASVGLLPILSKPFLTLLSPSNVFQGFCHVWTMILNNN